MDKKQIKEILNVLSIVSGDCPFERGIGEDVGCPDCPEPNCVDCWKVALSKELKNMEEMQDEN